MGAGLNVLSGNLNSDGFEYSTRLVQSLHQASHAPSRGLASRQAVLAPSAALLRPPLVPRLGGPLAQVVFFRHKPPSRRFVSSFSGRRVKRLVSCRKTLRTSAVALGHGVNIA